MSHMNESWHTCMSHVPHMALSRHMRSLIPQRDSPNLSKIEKVAETCEFDGNEPLFVERTIAISDRVLG